MGQDHAYCHVTDVLRETMLCEHLGLILRKVALSLTLRPHYYYNLLKILDSLTHDQYVKKIYKKMMVFTVILMSRVIRDNLSKWFSLNHLRTLQYVSSFDLVFRH